MSQVTLNNIQKKFGDVHVVKSINLDINDHEFIVLVGPSGCGKSTTLRMIAGLETITDGDLSIAGKKVNDVPAKERGVAMVFQDYALYPHMTIYENIAFSLRLKGKKDSEIDPVVQNVANMLDLTPYLKRKPAALSGGQRQRVAMGRAIAKNADVFLYDEPLSNLDAKLRSKMRTEIKKFHQKTKTTSVYVTHDQLEAMTLADRLVVMNQGEIEQIGTPMEVFENPRTLFVATFIGSPAMNLFNMKAINKNGEYFLQGKENSQFMVRLPKDRYSYLKEGQEVVLGVRPSDLFISTSNDGIEEEWKFDATVELIELLGKNAYVTFMLYGQECLGEIMGRDLPAIGSKVHVSFNLHHSHIFDPVTKLNLRNK